MQVGMKGSLAHVLTNPKVENKSACLKEMSKEAIKDDICLLGCTTAAVGIAANKDGIKNIAMKVKDTPFKEVLKKGTQKLSTAIKNPKELGKKILDCFKPEKLKAIPTPVKVGIIAGIAILATASAAKSGYIEGKHETK